MLRRWTLTGMKFETAFESDEVRDRVRSDMDLAEDLGLRGTPTVYINGEQNSTNSYDGIKAQIDEIFRSIPLTYSWLGDLSEGWFTRPSFCFGCELDQTIS